MSVITPRVPLSQMLRVQTSLQFLPPLFPYHPTKISNYVVESFSVTYRYTPAKCYLTKGNYPIRMILFNSIIVLNLLL